MIIIIVLLALSAAITLRWWITRKRFQINPSFSSPSCRPRKRPTERRYVATFYLLTVTHYFKIKYSNRDHLEGLNVIISQKKVTYCRHIGRRLLAFEWYIYIWPWPILQVNVKVMRISTVNISQTVTRRTNMKWKTVEAETAKCHFTRNAYNFCDKLKNLTIQPWTERSRSLL